MTDEERKQRRKEYVAYWRKRNRDKVNGYKRKWMENHPEAKEKRRQQHAEWVKKNPDKIREYARNYYRRKVIKFWKEQEAQNHE